MTNGMKSILSLLLCLCLALGALSATAEGQVNAAFYQAVNTNADTVVKTISSMASLGDAVYVLTQDTLERWAPGDAQPTAILTEFDNSDYRSAAEDGSQADRPAFSKLFADDQAVYGLNRTTGAVWKLADTAGPLSAPQLFSTLDLSGVTQQGEGDDYSYVPQMYETVLSGGVLYASLMTWDDNGQTCDFVRWDLATGKLLGNQTDLYLRSFTPYRDGLLLCKQYDENNSWDEATQTQKNPTLVTYDPSTGTVAPVFDFDDPNVYALRYNAATDTLYYVGGSVVYSFPGLQKPAKVSAYLPNQVWEDAACSLLPGGMFAVADYNGLIVRTLDAAGIENGALTIYGEYGSTGHQAYLAAYPDALVTCSTDYYNSLESFTNAMVSGANAVDVLRLDSDYSPLNRLIAKGYALDLSSYGDLMVLVNAMDPNLTKQGIQDGKVYAIPVEMYANAFGYNKEALKTLGLAAEDLPQNLPELLDFVSNWEDDYADDYPDLMLLDSGAVKNSLFDWIMTNYVAYQTQQGETIAFDTPLFQKIMKQFDSVDFTYYDEQDANQNDDYWSRTALFSLYTVVSYPGQYRYDNQFLPMPLDEGLEPVYPATVQYMIVNPRTARLEQAIQYLTTYAQNLEPSGSAVTLFPDRNDGVVNANYEKDLASWKESLADSQASLATADASEQASIQSTITYLQGLIDDADADRYTVSAEEIATYREQIAPYLVVTGQTPLSTWDDQGNNDLVTLEQQFLQGAIPMDQFIREIDKRMRMMQMEDQ